MAQFFHFVCCRLYSTFIYCLICIIMIILLKKRKLKKKYWPVMFITEFNLLHKDEVIQFLKKKILYKLVTLQASPSKWTSNTGQNQRIWDSPLYITITCEAIKVFWNCARCTMFFEHLTWCQKVYVYFKPFRKEII